MEDYKISLKAARVNAGMTQSEVAEVMGVALSTVVSWEKGHHQPSTRTVVKLAELYKIPIQGLSLANLINYYLIGGQ